MTTNNASQQTPAPAQTNASVQGSVNWTFEGKYVLTGHICCETGLHIGGTPSDVQIGGVDNAVIKDPLTDEPIIPGSSLKGKLRVLSEWMLGLVQKNGNSYTACTCAGLKFPRPASNTTRWDNEYALGRLFGVASNDQDVREMAGPSRLTVRDARLTSTMQLQAVLGDGVFTEIKTENAIDRVTAMANPRPMERVPAGAVFEFSLILDIYNRNDLPTHHDRELFKLLFSAMHMLEQSSLGGGGTRGNGQVSFENLSLVWRPVSYYQNGTGEEQVKLSAKTLAELASVGVAAHPPVPTLPPAVNDSTASQMTTPANK